jgi:hypothetical protein
MTSFGDRYDFLSSIRTTTPLTTAAACDVPDMLKSGVPDLGLGVCLAQLLRLRHRAHDVAARRHVGLRNPRRWGLEEENRASRSSCSFWVVKLSVMAPTVMA